MSNFWQAQPLFKFNPKANFCSFLNFFFLDYAMIVYSTPAAAIDILTESEANYIHWLFALKDKYLSKRFSHLILLYTNEIYIYWPV